MADEQDGMEKAWNLYKTQELIEVPDVSLEGKLDTMLQMLNDIRVDTERTASIVPDIEADKEIYDQIDDSVTDDIPANPFEENPQTTGDETTDDEIIDDGTVIEEDDEVAEDISADDESDIIDDDGDYSDSDILGDNEDFDVISNDEDSDVINEDEDNKIQSQEDVPTESNDVEEVEEDSENGDIVEDEDEEYFEDSDIIEDEKKDEDKTKKSVRGCNCGHEEEILKKSVERLVARYGYDGAERIIRNAVRKSDFRRRGI